MAVRLYGLLGWPVGHSVSPPMVNAAFNKLGLEAYYTAFAVPPEDFTTAVHGLSALRAGGVNVTIPHKQSALRLATSISDAAKLAGAVNTLKFISETREVLGHNTDVSGWWKSLKAQTGGRETWNRVLVLGAGGASRAVLAGLALNAPQAEVFIAARKYEQTVQMAKEFEPYLSIRPIAWEGKEKWISQSELVVNTTPVGMWPNTESSPVLDAGCFEQGQVVQDLVYRPLHTRFLQLAASHGALVATGLSMLVEQGAEAVAFWTGREPDIECMLNAANEALRAGAPDRVGSDSI